MQNKKSIKVCYQGETKRIKMTQSYESLALQTREAFGQGLEKVWPIKFYYLDDESELISINSQNDYLEAISIDDFSLLKLTVAANALEARALLEKSIMDNQSLGQSLNNSQYSGMKLARCFTITSETNKLNDFDSPFEQILTSRTEPVKFKPISHEMGVGSESIKIKAQDAGTDIGNLVRNEEKGCMTKIATKDSSTTNHIAVVTASSQIGAETKEMGCDGIPTVVMVSNGTMADQVQKVEQEVNCQILISDDDENNEECIEEQMSCFKCLGSQVNKKGLPCRKCNGSGVFSMKGLGDVVRLVKEEIEGYCTESFKGLFVEFMDKKRADQQVQDHSPYLCDGCGMNPIKGIRFTCSVCHNYDLCQNCESKGIHIEHPMLKIRRPSQAPNRIICQYGSQDEQVEQTQNRVSNNQTKGSRQFDTCKDKKPVRYQGRFVKESFGDKHQVAPGQVFVKEWTLRNDGQIAWPQDLYLIQTSGDDMKAQQVQVEYAVQPDSDYVWRVKLTAPQMEGKYTTFFRMQTGHSVRFGHKVWCDIQVVQPKEEVMSQKVAKPQVEEILGQSFEIDNGEALNTEAAQVGEPVYPSLHDFMFGDKQTDLNEPEVKPQPFDLTKSSIFSSQNMMTPKMVYFDQVAKETFEPLRKDLTQLYEFGFVDFQVNKSLLLKHKSADSVAAILCEGQLSESNFKQVFPQ